MKLWELRGSVDGAVERFCAGEDRRLDQALVPYDVEASLGHAKGLARIGILTAGELRRLAAAFAAIRRLHAAGRFRVRPRDEDCHTAIELFLTKRLGALGKKIHTGRSRNDQVIAALRLYAKDRLRDIAGAAADLAQALLDLGTRHERAPMPGYTHTRKAMPSSMGLWAGAYAEALIDDLSLLEAAYRLVDQSPLGSAAGYGVPLPLDREGVARALGFARVQNNTLYVQNSRGKFEAFGVAVFAQVMLDVNRLATDLIFFSGEHVGYVSLPERFTTGSSIMPQKRNPDVLELARAGYHSVVGDGVAIHGTCGNLIAGYHRDLQLTKESFMRAAERTLATTAILGRVIPGVRVDAARCRAACTPEIFAAGEATELAAKGLPFREAYRHVKAGLAAPGPRDPAGALKRVAHAGGPGRPNLAAARRALERYRGHSPLFQRRSPAKP